MTAMPVALLTNGGAGVDAQGNVIAISGIECLIAALEARYGALDQGHKSFLFLSS